jgi:hypothetical protein
LVSQARKEDNYIGLGQIFMANFYTVFDKSGETPKVGVALSKSSLGSIRKLDDNVSPAITFLIVVISLLLVAGIGFLVYRVCIGKKRKIDLKKFIQDARKKESFVDPVILQEDQH